MVLLLLLLKTGARKRLRLYPFLFWGVDDEKLHVHL